MSLVKVCHKISKYKNLEIEIEKTTSVPVITGILGMIKKGIDNHIKKIPCSPSRYEEGTNLPSYRNSQKSERIENAPLAILISTEQF